MTAAASGGFAREFWKRDPEFDHIEVSNTGKVRNSATRAALPVIGSGGKAHVQITDKHGRRHDRNVRRLVRKIYGTAPIRLFPQPVDLVAEFVGVVNPPTVEPEETPVTDHVPPPSPNDQDWVALQWPGVRDGYRISRSGEVLTYRNAYTTGTVQRSSFGDYIVMNLNRVPNSDYLADYTKVRLDELVATHFIGPKPDGDYVARHINGDTMDNRVDNLEWGLRVLRRFKSPLIPTVRGSRRLPARDRNARVLNADPAWRQVVSPKVAANSFWVTQDGRCRGVSNKDLTPQIAADGRVYISMKSQGGSNTNIPLDRIVLEAFSEERPTPQHRVIHRNGDAQDCHLDNLYWGIPGEGERKPTPKPTPQPAPIITPTRAEVKVTTLAAYRIGDVEVIVNNGIIEPPKGGTAVQQAAALAQIYAEIAKGAEQ